MAQPPLPIPQPGYGLQQPQVQRTPVARGKAAALDAYLAQGGTTFRKSGRFKKGKHRGKSYDEVKAEFERMWATAPDAVKDKYASRALETDLSPSEKKAFEQGNPAVTQQPQYPQPYYPPQAQGQLPAQQPRIGSQGNPGGDGGFDALTDPNQPWNYNADPNQQVQAVGTDANGDGMVNNADAAAAAAAPVDANNQPVVQKPKLRGENYSLAQDGRLAPMKPRGESPFPVSQPGTPAPVATQDASRDPATPADAVPVGTEVAPGYWKSADGITNVDPNEPQRKVAPTPSAPINTDAEGTPLGNFVDKSLNWIAEAVDGGADAVATKVSSLVVPESETAVKEATQAHDAENRRKEAETAQLEQRRIVAENTARALADAGLAPDPNAETFADPAAPAAPAPSPAIQTGTRAPEPGVAPNGGMPAPTNGQGYAGMREPDPANAGGVTGSATPSPVAKPRGINKLTGLPFGYRPGDDLSGRDQGVQQKGVESYTQQAKTMGQAAQNGTLGRDTPPPAQKPLMPRGPESRTVSGERKVSQATRDYVAKTKQDFAEVGASNARARGLTEAAVAQYGSVEAAPLPVQWGLNPKSPKQAPQAQGPAKKPFFTGSPSVARPSAQGFSRVRRMR